MSLKTLCQQKSRSSGCGGSSSRQVAASLPLKWRLKWSKSRGRRKRTLRIEETRSQLGGKQALLGACFLLCVCSISPSPPFASASLIIGDSAIEIQEVDSSSAAPNNKRQNEEPSLILGSTSGATSAMADSDNQLAQLAKSGSAQGQVPQVAAKLRTSPNGPLPPLAGNEKRQTGKEDITDGDRRSRDGHDFELNADQTLSAQDGRQPDEALEKSIAGKVVDFELLPAGGHNKAKVKKKKKKKLAEKKSEKAFKKWNKKKHMEKKAMEKKEKEHMKKKKEQGKKNKKKWGHEEHGQKKKGKFKKKKWGKNVKKGKGVKKGKKGKKFLKDKGHKNTGFKRLYHIEEYGKSSKWHDIKREKKWDEKSKKWKKKWKKEKGKKYKGDHTKKFEKKKKEGKKYKKLKKEKVEKFKKEKYEAGKKMKKEEHKKKKEGGMKKEEMKKKMEKKKKKKKP